MNIHSAASIVLMLLSVFSVMAAPIVDIGLEAADNPSVLCPDENPVLLEDGDSFKVELQGIVPQDTVHGCPWITSSISFAGARAMGIRLVPNPGTNGSTADRNEISVVRDSDTYAFHLGQTRYFGFAIYIHNSASDWPLAQDVIFMQAWQVNCGPKVPLFARLLKGTGDTANPLKFAISAYDALTRHTVVAATPITKSAWHTFVFKMLPSYVGMCAPPFLETGLVEVWMDGLKIATFNHSWGHQPGSEPGSPGSPTTDQWHVRCGLYRGRAEQDLVAFFDNIRYADNLCDANPANP